MIRKNQVAPKYATGTVNSTTTLTIENGEPIWVYGIIISRELGAGNATNDISIKTGNGSTTLFVIDSRAGNEANIFDIPFKADSGLSFTGTTTATKRVTVFYSGPGA